MVDLGMTELLHGLPDDLHCTQAQEALGRFWRVNLRGFRPRRVRAQSSKATDEAAPVDADSCLTDRTRGSI